MKYEVLFVVYSRQLGSWGAITLAASEVDL